MVKKTPPKMANINDIVTARQLLLKFIEVVYDIVEGIPVLEERLLPFEAQKHALLFGKKSLAEIVLAISELVHEAEFPYQQACVPDVQEKKLSDADIALVQAFIDKVKPGNIPA